MKTRSFKKAAIILTVVYFQFVFCMQTISLNVNMTIAIFSMIFVINLLLVYVLFYKWEPLLCRIHFKENSKNAIIIGIIVASLTWLIFEAYLAAQYPGGMSTDTGVQYAQALGETPYSDWHPVIHTLLFFTLPLKTGHGLGFIVFLQMLWFALAFGYLCYVLCYNKFPFMVILFLCVYVFTNPYLATYLVYPWKDIALVIFAMVLTAFYIQIICSKGQWIKKPFHMALFSFFAVLCWYIRHNAPLFVLPLMMIIFFYAIKDKKTRVLFAGAFLVFFFSVKLLYAGLNVQKPGSRTEETIGLPLTIWSNVMKKEPAALPESTRHFLYEIAPEETYEKYEPGSYNSIKWGEIGGTVNRNLIEKMTYSEVLKYTFQCFRYAPDASFEAFSKLTALVWSIDGRYQPTYVFVMENWWNIKSSPLCFASLFQGSITFFSSGFGMIFYGSVGFQFLCMFVAGTLLLAKGKLSIIHLIPLFCYDFGTMLLLSGSDYRLFLLNIPLWIVIVSLQYKNQLANCNEVNK